MGQLLHLACMHLYISTSLWLAWIWLLIAKQENHIIRYLVCLLVVASDVDSFFLVHPYIGLPTNPWESSAWFSWSSYYFFPFFFGATLFFSFQIFLIVLPHLYYSTPKAYCDGVSWLLDQLMSFLGIVFHIGRPWTFWSYECKCLMFLQYATHLASTTGFFSVHAVLLVTFLLDCYMFFAVRHLLKLEKFVECPNYVAL